MIMTCPYCGKEHKTQEHTVVSTCNHCFKSFRKVGAVPMMYDMSGPIGGFVKKEEK